VAAHFTSAVNGKTRRCVRMTVNPPSLPPPSTTTSHQSHWRQSYLAISSLVVSVIEQLKCACCDSATHSDIKIHAAAAGGAVCGKYGPNTSLTKGKTKPIIL